MSLIFCHNIDCARWGVSTYKHSNDPKCVYCGFPMFQHDTIDCSICKDNRQKLRDLRAHVETKKQEPKQKVCVGMFRPLFEDALKQITEASHECSGCGANIASYVRVGSPKDGGILWTDEFSGYEKSIVREHWQLGHFDTPVYKEV